MAKPKRFRNQGSEQVLKHLAHLLNENLKYDLSADPLGVYLEIRECTRQPKKKLSKKRLDIKAEQSTMSNKARKLSNTKKRIRPKIRTVKKGRTVPLKGIVY